MPYTEQDGLPFAAGSQTSYKAARSVARGRGKKTLRYLAALKQRGVQGFTDSEASAFLGLPVSSLCSIRGATMACGLVAKSGEERIGRYGKKCSVFVLVECLKGAE